MEPKEITTSQQVQFACVTVIGKTNEETILSNQQFWHSRGVALDWYW